MALAGTYSLKIAFADRTTSNTPGVNVHSINEEWAYTMADGSGASQSLYIWGVDFSLAISTPVTYDLTALTGPKGTTTFAKVKGIAIKNDSATDGHRILAGNGSNPWAPFLSSSTATWEIAAGGVWYQTNPLIQTTNPWTVSGSAKTVKLDPGTNAITGTIVIWGI